MAHFALLAILGTISRAWLALPICLCAAGYALHLVSVQASEQEAAAINAHNASIRFTVDQPFRYLRQGDTDSCALIERYRIDRSFLRQGKSEITTAYHARCRNVQAVSGRTADRRGIASIAARRSGSASGA